MLKIIVLAIILSSCVTMQQAKTKKVLDSWIGKTESQLIQEWGIPSNHMTNESGQKIYEYVKCKSGGMVLPGTNLIGMKQVCDHYTFFIGNGIIVSNTYRRN